MDTMEYKELLIELDRIERNSSSLKKSHRRTEMQQGVPSWLKKASIQELLRL